MAEDPTITNDFATDSEERYTGTSKAKLGVVLGQLNSLKEDGLDLFGEVSGFSYLYYASARGGKVYDHKTYLAMASQSLEGFDRDIGKEFTCDMYVVQKARANLIAVGDFVLQRHGFGTGIELYKHELTARQLLDHALSYRGYLEAQKAAVHSENEHKAINYLLHQYSNFATTRFMFDELGIDASEKDVQYHDRSMRLLLKGEDRTAGFPQLADRVLFGWMLKFNDPNETRRLMTACAGLMNLNLGSAHPDYSRQSKIQIFLRHMVAEEAWLANHQIESTPKDFIPLFPKKTISTDPENVHKHVNMPSLFRKYAEHQIMPASMRNLFKAFANDEPLDTYFQHAFPRTTYREGIRVTKSMLYHLKRTTAATLLQFNSPSYYEQMEKRIVAMTRKKR